MKIDADELITAIRALKIPDNLDQPLQKQIEDTAKNIGYSDVLIIIHEMLLKELSGNMDSTLKTTLR